MKKFHIPKKFYLIIALALIVVVCLIARAVYAPSHSSLPQVEEGKVTLRGTAACLPHADANGPQTLECALGLKTDDGLYYALTGAASAPIASIKHDHIITVKGILHKEVDRVYQSQGTITVDELIE